jgi:hypothetical protein
VDFVTANKFAEDAEVGEATVESGIPVSNFVTANKFAEDAEVGEARVESGIPVSNLVCVLGKWRRCG